jgi:hypothetical protein
MSSRRKGVLIDKKFLTGIIPEHWKERIYEFDGYYACMVEGERNEEQFATIVKSCKEEFGDLLMEVFSKTSYGVSFIVYLKKTV